jgi:chorismate mutase
MIRPSREAEVLYRLMERHKGPFPKQEIARIWRELIEATSSLEGPYSVAENQPEHEPG